MTTSKPSLLPDQHKMTDRKSPPKKPASPPKPPIKTAIVIKKPKATSPTSEAFRKAWTDKYKSSNNFSGESKTIENKFRNECIAGFLDSDSPINGPEWKTLVRSFAHARVGVNVLKKIPLMDMPTLKGGVIAKPDSTKLSEKAWLSRRTAFLADAQAVINADGPQLRSVVWSRPAYCRTKPKPQSPKKPESKTKPAVVAAKPKSKSPPKPIDTASDWTSNPNDQNLLDMYGDNDDQPPAAVVVDLTSESKQKKSKSKSKSPPKPKPKPKSKSPPKPKPIVISPIVVDDIKPHKPIDSTKLLRPRPKQRTRTSFVRRPGAIDLTPDLLVQMIDDNVDHFIDRVKENLKSLMIWKLSRYDALIEMKAGSKAKAAVLVAKVVADNAKQAKSADTGEKQMEMKGKSDRDDSEDYAIALIQKRILVDAIVPITKTKKKRGGAKKKGTGSDTDSDGDDGERKLIWTDADLADRLKQAIQDPQNGIESLTGAARAPIRQSLLEAIFALSQNITRFKEGENLVLTGPSGSGKTKAASVIGFVYSRIGVMATETFQDVPTTAIVSAYVNATAAATQKKVLASLEGVILIDEFYRLDSRCDTNQASTTATFSNNASPVFGSPLSTPATIPPNSPPSLGRRGGTGYHLLRKPVPAGLSKYHLLRKPARTGGADDHGLEAITQLVAMLAEIRGLIVIIVAGYAPNMDCVLNTNEGLRRRFVSRMNLEDFTSQDLTDLFMKKLTSALQNQTGGRKLKIRPYATAYIQAIFGRLIDLKAMQQQGGDIDLLANYIGTELARAALDGLKWNNYDQDDDLIILNRAFNRFGERKNLVDEFVLPASDGSARAAGCGICRPKTSRRTGGTSLPDFSSRFRPSIRL